MPPATAEALNDPMTRRCRAPCLEDGSRTVGGDSKRFHFVAMLPPLPAGSGGLPNFFSNKSRRIILATVSSQLLRATSAATTCDRVAPWAFCI